ncbi:MAG: AI-2E family transporter [Candidatus Uhrbacteria bacterium]
MTTQKGGSDKPAKQLISISTGTILKIIAIFAALWFVWFVRDILAVIFVALLLAALIDPVADWFSTRKIPRSLAVILVYLLLFCVVAFVVIMLVPPVIAQVSALLINFGYYDQVATYIERFSSLNLGESVADNIGQLTTSIQHVFATLSGFIGGIAAMVIVLVLAFYMVVEEEAARGFFKTLSPVKYQSHLATLFIKMQKKIGLWLRGQIILGLIVGIVAYIGLSILDVQYALVLAIMAGLFEIVPYIGPVAAAIPAVILALLQDPIKGVMVAILYVVIQWLENNILVPKIMQKVTGLNPIVSIVALLVGLKIAGIVGAVLAVPVATMVAVILEDLFSEDGLLKKV